MECLTLEEREDLARLGMPVELGLFEHRRAVAQNLESAAPGRDQLHVGIRKLPTNLGGQTGRPRLVVSERAVFDADLHVIRFDCVCQRGTK